MLCRLYRLNVSGFSDVTVFHTLKDYCMRWFDYTLKFKRTKATNPPIVTQRGGSAYYCARLRRTTAGIQPMDGTVTDGADCGTEDT
jgi:hypothetical protein